MVTLERFSSREEAEVVKALLAAHSIDSWIHADDQGGMRPSLAFIHGAELLVRSEDLLAARRILEAAMAASDDEAN